MKEYFQGQVLTVMQSETAARDLEKLLLKAKSSQQKLKDLANLDAIIESHANKGYTKNREKVNYEDDGFWCFKAYQIRAYFWSSKKYPKTIIISHVIEKKQDKLSKADREKMRRIRKEIEK